MKESSRQAYLSYFDTLKIEQKILEGLYKPVQLTLDGEDEKSLEFSIRWDVDVEGWFERGMSLFDHRKGQPLGGIDNLTSLLGKSLFAGWQSGDIQRIEEGILKLRKLLTETKAHAALKSSSTVAHLLEWAFDVEHINLAYGLRYQGTALEKLSPGTKGIVLLILYLGMDIEDTRPLVIDQPEENLDSESIYHLGEILQVCKGETTSDPYNS